MGYLSKIADRSRTVRLPDQLRLILTVTTGILMVIIVFNTIHLIRYMRAERLHHLSQAAREIGPFPLIWSIVSMLLFVLVGWGFWLILRRRQVDQLRLRRSEQKYRNIINHAGEAIFLLDRDGLILEWNKVAEALFGEPRRNVLGKPFRDIHLCWGVEIDRAMKAAEKSNSSMHFEMPLRRGEMPENGLVAMSVSPVAAGPRDDVRTERGYVVIARDVTSERRLEDKMSETEKLASIGQIAAGVAHQLNTPLGSILLSAQMLEEANESEEDAEDLQRIIRQTEQCRTIIKGLLNFARASGRERSPQNLAELVHETVFLMEKNLKVAGVEVEIDERDPLTIHGNRNELEQVFFNLVSNALDAMPDGGRIEISLEESAPGEGVVVFRDTGPGISAEAAEKIFLPFYTTKEYGKGTGLGLAILARIIHEHGGRVELKRDADEPGARFVMSFPLLREDTPEA